MPENQPPDNDPFADLYGRLPDPRTGARSGDAVPSSRRAARAARQADGPSADTARPTPSDAGVRPSASETAGSPRDEDVAAPRRAADAPHAGVFPAAGARVEPAAGPADDAARPVRRSSGSAAPRPRVTEPVRERVPALVGAGVAPGASASATNLSSGSLEDLFTGQATTHDIGEPVASAPKRRRRIGGWIAFAVVVLLVGGVVGGGFALWNTYGERIQAFLGNEEPVDYEAGMATGEARVTIVSGDTGESVSPKLFEAGVTKASNSLYKYMVDNAVGFTFQPGVYKLQQQMTSEAVLAALRDPANRLNYTVQLREGLTLAQSLDLITEQLGIARADLDAAVADPSQYGVPASTLEGWIFPATYDFDEGVTAQQVIDTMVKRTVQSLDAAGVPESDRERILIIASIIEREARSSEDFYKVSRVIENRLQPTNQETFGKLEMDSTVQYGAGEMGSGSVSTSEEARNSDNPWNTYMYPGLPIGPIANAGDLAIDAAMHPADGPWLYFVTVNLDTGETVFTSTLSEHEKAVAQWQAWCAENPDGGC